MCLVLKNPKKLLLLSKNLKENLLKGLPATGLGSFPPLLHRPGYGLDAPVFFVRHRGLIERGLNRKGT